MKRFSFFSFFVILGFLLTCVVWSQTTTTSLQDIEKDVDDLLVVGETHSQDLDGLTTVAEKHDTRIEKLEKKGTPSLAGAVEMFNVQHIASLIRDAEGAGYTEDEAVMKVAEYKKAYYAAKRKDRPAVAEQFNSDLRRRRMEKAAEQNEQIKELQQQIKELQQDKELREQDKEQIKELQQQIKELQQQIKELQQQNKEQDKQFQEAAESAVASAIAANTAADAIPTDYIKTAELEKVKAELEKKTSKDEFYAMSEDLLGKISVNAERVDALTDALAVKMAGKDDEARAKIYATLLLKYRGDHKAVREHLERRMWKKDHIDKAALANLE